MARHVIVGLALALAAVWTTTAVAGEARKGGTRATGTVVSVKIEGEATQWEVDLGAEGGKKTFEMPVEVRVLYTEKDGAKQALRIMRTGGRTFTPKEPMQLATGKITAAKVEGENVLVSVTPTEGEKPAAVEVKLATKVSVSYREGEGGKLMAYGIGVPRTPRKAE
jgi:hypothetical protein